MTKRIITGIKASGDIHLGNYLGAIKPLLESYQKLEANDHIYFFVPDLHTFTVQSDHERLYSRIIDNVRIYLASGFKQASNFTLFRQSHVPQHCELAWTLSCFSYFGELSRMTQFKDKSQSQEKVGEPITVGLFTYPVLMVADILLYDIDYVPLGEDQKQHLELCRDIAIRMNNAFEKQAPEGLFRVPKPWNEQLEYSHLEHGIRIRSLHTPEKKMSKSVSDPKGTIALLDDPDEAVKKVLSAATDNEAHIRWDFNTQPGITNLLQIYYLLKGITREECLHQWVGYQKYGEFKKQVAHEVKEFLIAFQEQYRLINDNLIQEVLIVGETDAKNYAQKTLTRVYESLGLKSVKS